MQIKILDAGKAPSRISTRYGKQDMVVYYSVDGKGKYTVSIPYEDYTETLLQETIIEEEAERRAIVGIEFNAPD